MQKLLAALSRLGFDVTKPPPGHMQRQQWLGQQGGQGHSEPGQEPASVSSFEMYSVLS